MQGLSNRPYTDVFWLRRTEHPACSTPLLSPWFRCNTHSDSFPSLIFTFPTYLRWVTGSVMSWATCGGFHASIYLQTTRRLTSPRNCNPSPLYALDFILVLSCFHVLHAIPILSLLYRVPATIYYPFNNFYLHTSYLLYQLPRRPKLKIRRHLVTDFGPTTAQNQITWLLPRGPTFGELNFAPLIFYLFGARGPCPLLPIFEATPPRTHAVGYSRSERGAFITILFLSRQTSIT